MKQFQKKTFSLKVVHVVFWLNLKVHAFLEISIVTKKASIKGSIEAKKTDLRYWEAI